MSMDCLIIFTKYPEKGMVKTRLAKVIGDEASEDLAESVLVDLCNEHYNREYDIFISFSPEDKEDEFREFLPDLNFLPQIGGNVGKRMENAIKALMSHYDKIILIKSNAPDVDSSLISSSFNLLDKYDVVIGPTQRNDFYLIGMKAFHDIFSGISWEQNVFEQIKNKIKSNKLVMEELKEKTELISIEDIKSINLKKYQPIETTNSIKTILAKIESNKSEGFNPLPSNSENIKTGQTDSKI